MKDAPLEWRAPSEDYDAAFHGPTSSQVLW